MKAAGQADLAPRIKARALEEGFAACGICAPDAIPQARARLAAFVAAGRHGTMRWMAERTGWRGDPAALWPEARSVIMLAELYTPEDDPLRLLKMRERGSISVYARGRDYHDVVKKRLKRLAAGWWPRRGGNQGVRRYCAGDGEAAGTGGGARLAGQAHQPAVAPAGQLVLPRARSSPSSSCRATRRGMTIAATAGPASTSARPRHSRRPISSTPGAASRT